MTNSIVVLFLLGLLAVVLYIFGLFNWFAPWWALVIMVFSFTMLTRIWQRENQSEKERLQERIQELEAQLKLR